MEAAKPPERLTNIKQKIAANRLLKQETIAKAENFTAALKDKDLAHLDPDVKKWSCAMFDDIMKGRKEVLENEAGIEKALEDYKAEIDALFSKWATPMKAIFEKCHQVNVAHREMTGDDTDIFELPRAFVPKGENE